MSVTHHEVDNGLGTRLALRRTPADPRAPPAASGARPRPLLIVPGYGMNSFIFSFHPKGPSLEASLAARGIDVWSVDLRGQGASVTSGEAKGRPYGLADLAGPDVGAAIDHVARETGGPIDLLGASLGATLVFAHLARRPEAPVASVVSLGGLVTWTKVPPLLRALFFSPRLIGRVPFRGTRGLAGLALPALARVAPGLLSIYLHTESTDVQDARTMVQTVEDPNPRINREIAEWIRARELVLDGVNVSRALAGLRRPLLCVVALQDGIVPPETGRAVFDEAGSSDKELLEVGTPEHPMAHADLFLSTGAQESVFLPIATFLRARA